MPLPKLDDAEKWILGQINSNGGHIPSVSYLAEKLDGIRPKIYHHHLIDKSTTNLKTLAQQIGKVEINDLERKGYIRKERRGNCFAIIITDEGSTVVDFIKDISK